MSMNMHVVREMAKLGTTLTPSDGTMKAILKDVSVRPLCSKYIS